MRRSNWLKRVPKVAEAASSDELKQAILAHLEETKGHVERAEQAFAETGKAARAKKCEAMAGLIEETEKMLEEEAAPEVLDAVIIGLAQKVEHYEIATYGTLCTWAEVLGYSKAKAALSANLNEEEKADKKLTQISKTVNKTAAA